MLAVARDLVINPDDLSRWITPAAPFATPLAQHTPVGPQDLAPGALAWARFEISQPALVRLDPAALDQAGLGTDLAAIRVFREGQSVALHRISPPDPHAGIYLRAAPRDSEYGRAMTYYLANAPAAPDPQLEPFVFPDSAENAAPLAAITRRVRLDRDHVRHLEQDNFLSIRGIQWVDARVSDNDPLDLPLVFRAPEPTAPATARIVFRVDGPPAATTGTQLALRHGAEELGRIDLNAASSTEFNLPIPAGMLREGLTTFTLAVTRATSATLDVAENSEEPAGASIWLDWIEVTYPARPALLEGTLVLSQTEVTTQGALRFDLDPAAAATPRLGLVVDDAATTSALITDPTRAWVDATRHTEWRSLASALAPPLHKQTWQADWFADRAPFDYLIITHSRFADQLEPLLQLNAARGLKTRVIDIQTVFDMFTGGNLSPQAIRLLLAWLSEVHGLAAPSFVLLVGDSSSDYLDFLRSGVENLVPSYSHTENSETWSSEFWLTRIVGEDDLGDFMLGRISVNNREDAQHAIDKIVRYATRPEWGPWRARMAYVADNLEAFTAAAENVRGWTPEGVSPLRTYLDEQPLEDNWYIPTRQIERIWAEEKTWMKVSGSATRRIRDTFNNGVAYLDYFGHGSPNIWTDERIWFGGDSPNRDAQVLKSDGRYAFVTNYTCNTGAIDYPMPRWNICISEDLQRQPDGGAVGLFVPSGPGTTPEHEKLAREWRRALFEDDVRNPAAAALLARSRLALSGEIRKMILMYAFLGDPAMDLQLVRHQGTAQVTPGAEETIVTTAEGVQPSDGKALAWIQDAADGIAWQSKPWDYKGGSIQQGLKLPAEYTKLGSGQKLFLYAWNEQSAEDWSARAEPPASAAALVLRAAVADRASSHALLTLENTGDEPAAGEVEIARVHGSTLESPNRTKVNVRADEVTTLTLVLPPTEASPCDTLVYEARLIPQHPSDDLSVAAQPTLRFADYPDSEGWVAIVPELGAFTHTAPNVPARLEIPIACGKLTTHTLALALRAPGGDMLTSTPLSLAPAGELFTARAVFTVPALLRSLPPETEINLLVDGYESAKGTLSSVPVLAPRVRIKPASLSHTPAAPTDGETIFINLEVENAGNAPSGAFTPEIYDGDPAQGGKALRQQSGAPKVIVGPLGAGRSTAIALRWDPIENAGVQNIWIDLRATPGAPAEQTLEQRSAYRLFVRSKARLARDGAPFASQTAEDKRNNTYKLHCGVRNDGETPARNVEVNFFLGAEQTPEQKIGTVQLEEVPARGSAEAVLEWKFDAAKYPDVKLEELKPTTEIRLRGSQQRLGR